MISFNDLRTYYNNTRAFKVWKRKVQKFGSVTRGTSNLASVCFINVALLGFCASWWKNSKTSKSRDGPIRGMLIHYCSLNLAPKS